MRLGNKGFILIDSLLSVFIILSMCGLCFAVYHSISVYDDSYDRYQEEINSIAEDIFVSLDDCEPCVNDESD